MGWRFRRRVRILPGLYVNVSKSGVSTSIGVRGATLNISRQGTRTTLGLPGSGLSYRSPLKPWAARTSAPAPPRVTFQASPAWMRSKAPPPQTVTREPSPPMPAGQTAFEIDEDGLPPQLLEQASDTRSRRSLGFLFAVFLVIGALGLVAMSAIDTAMKSSTVTPPPPERVHRGHDG